MKEKRLEKIILAVSIFGTIIFIVWAVLLIQTIVMLHNAGWR